ncbi:hypothetical protein SCHIN_v1c00910 [Spiroplasma chinense]|uniref:Uncharacterized protein n=1 Tax=Spiroplasma chinense TaxID=216932 RepID=A0A5B9Y3N5_9MOLU|nr:hypothetical protein [Spiroplasma chinense]QEH61289.1 hypothetical protein SCHIN_v1c00910 [Spiroplasma chinense]
MKKLITVLASTLLTITPISASSGAIKEEYQVNNKLRVDSRSVIKKTISLNRGETHDVGPRDTKGSLTFRPNKSADFFIDLKNIGLTTQQLYSSKFTFNFNSVYWDLRSDAKGWVIPNPESFEVSYLEWYTGQSDHSIGKMLVVDLPQLIKKETNYISMIQTNLFLLDEINRVVYGNIFTTITTYIKSYSSGNNTGTVWFGINSIDIEYFA